MLSKMLIPKEIVVGYQERKDTYTGNLAYVIYKDLKGKLRKEASWSSWRDTNIDSDSFKNEPTSGFVLNKDVGGVKHSWGWNTRNSYIRVFDPRGFEFEITLPNLLFILQETSSIKGKGLEGEFVYAWDRADLVLLPTSSQEYINCTKYTSNQVKKVTKKDMEPGCLYLMKDMRKGMYLGRHEWFEPKFSRGRDYGERVLRYESKGKLHIFKNMESEDSWSGSKVIPLYHYLSEPEYLLERGFTKVAERITQDAHDSYSDEYEKLVNSAHCLPPKSAEFVKPPSEYASEDDYMGSRFFEKIGDNYYYTSVYKNHAKGKGLVTYRAKIPVTMEWLGLEDPSSKSELRMRRGDVDQYRLRDSCGKAEYPDLDSFVTSSDMYCLYLKNDKGYGFDITGIY